MCHAGWPDNDGLAAPRNEPVLSLVAMNDAWFSGNWLLQGDCGMKMYGDNGSQSHVFHDELASRHDLVAYPRVQAIVLEFPEEHLAR